MFVDASVMIAMLTGDRDGDRIADELAGPAIRPTSLIAAWEGVAGLVKRYMLSVPEAQEKVRELIATTRLRLVDIGRKSLESRSAYAKFGKGRHPARLNMGGCFAYPCGAKAPSPLTLPHCSEAGRLFRKAAGSGSIAPGQPFVAFSLRRTNLDPGGAS